jgi:hypothetical protein
VLEAADLLQSGVSKRVAVFTDSGPDHEFIRRGLPYDDQAATQICQLRSLGVTDIVRISALDGTDAEGQALPQWCDCHQLKSIVLLTTKFKNHSRRVRRVLGRVMKGHHTHVAVQAARYSIFDPDRWWEIRQRPTEIVELPKLVLDFVLRPMSF